AQSEKFLCQFEITRIAGFAIQINAAHVMRRTNRTPRRFRSGFGKSALEKLGGLDCDCEMVGLAGRLMMYASSGEEMAEVVHLEIMTILKRRGVGVPGADRHQRRRMNIAVVALRQSDQCDDFVHLRSQRFIRSNRVRGAESLE